MASPYDLDAIYRLRLARLDGLKKPEVRGSIRNWQQVAMRVGEALGTDGPVGYYGFTPEQWQDWCLAEVYENRRLLQALRDAAADAKWTPPLR